MTKKDFISLANELRALLPDCGDAAYHQWSITVEALASWCASQNSAFNRQRWLGYINGDCGPNGGTVRVTADEAARRAALADEQAGASTHVPR